MSARVGSTARSAATREEMIGRARELVPFLRERAGKAEAERRISEEVHRAFVDAGFYRLFQPARYGGHEMDLGMMVEVGAELGRGCGSSAWVFSNIAVQAWINGMRGPEAQEAIWGDNAEAHTASSFPGRGAAVRRASGGIVVDGVWSFASGIDVAEWNALQVMVPSGDGPPEHRFALVPRAEFEVIDDWFVTGLAGTGSKSLRVEEVFVPDYMTLRSSDIRGGPTPGSAVSDNALFKLPMWAIGVKVFSGPTIGMAQGAVEAIESDIAGRLSIAGVRLSEQPTVHMRIAEASAGIDAARALLLRDCDEAMDIAAAGVSPAVDTRVRWRRNDGFAGQLCVRAVERLHALAGARGLSSSSHFQRAWRDVHAAVSQIGMAWDIQGTNYGRVRFGMTLPDPKI